MRIVSIDTQKIAEVRARILQLAAEQDLDTTVFLAALADVVGITVAVLREVGAAHQRAGLDARLAQFAEHARATYARTRRDLVDHRPVSDALARGTWRT